MPPDVALQSKTLKKIGYCSPPAEPWKKGVSPNPGGKPVKSRNALSGKFFKELAADFEKHGKKAIIEARECDPMGYVKMVAGLMPKEFEITKPLDEVTDEQLDAAAIAIRAILNAQSDRHDEGRSGEAQPAEVLQTVPQTG